jgi:exopolysaccharide production protein ExoZ
MARTLGYIQVLRGIAASLVVADHAIYFVSTKEEVNSTWLSFAHSLGAFGVDLFFVISGFIMIYTSNDLFGSRAGALSFAYRRIIRIVPMYWLATAIALLLEMRRSGMPSLWHILSSMFFIPQVTDPGYPLRPILGVGWTLNYEMMFYAAFTVCLLLPKRLGVTSLIFTFCTFVCIGSFFRPLTETGDPVTVLTFILNPIILLFAAGVLLGLYVRPMHWRGASVPLVGPVSIVLVAVTVALFPVASYKTWPLSSSGAFYETWSLSWQIVFWALAAAIVGLAGRAGEPREGALTSFFHKLGDASYSIYLIHFMAIAGVSRAWQALGGGINTTGFMLAAFVAALVIGAMVHVVIENPLLHILRRVTSPTEAARREISLELKV